jgi:hypothetical protein
MAFIVAAIGILIAALGVVGLVAPGTLVRAASAVWQSRAGLYVAVILRVVLGVALIRAASGSRYPNALGILGIISILGALVALILGFERLRAFVKWWVARPSWLIQTWGLIAGLLGVFLVYAVY